jgi:SulP family sulfate permease
MVEKSAIATLLRASRGDAAVLLITLLLTVFRDLTEAIIVGFALGSVLFIHRMSQMTAIEAQHPFVSEDKPDDANGDREPYDENTAQSEGVVIYRMSGAFFFGAAASIEAVLDRISDTHRVLILDFTQVPFVDSTAAHTIEGLAHKASRRGAKLVLTGTTHAMRRDLFVHGIKPPLVAYEPSIEHTIQGLQGAR